MNLLDQYKGAFHYPRSRVYCYNCGTHLYDMDKITANQKIELSMLHPSSYFIVAPTTRRCPICGLSFTGPDGELLAESIKGEAPSSPEKNIKNAIEEFNDKTRFIG